MLELLARYADAWNTGWGGDTEDLLAKAAKLDAACEAIGRDPKTVVRTTGVAVAAEGFEGDPASVVGGSIDEQVAFFKHLEAAGFDHFSVRLNPFTPDNVMAFSAVIDAFHAAG